MSPALYMCHVSPHANESIVTPLHQPSHPPRLYSTVHHKVLIYTYIEHHSVCPLVGIGTPPTPLSQAMPSLPDQMDVEHTRPRLRGWGSPNSDDWRKSLALCLLCAVHLLVSNPTPHNLALTPRSMQNLSIIGPPLQQSQIITYC